MIQCTHADAIVHGRNKETIMYKFDVYFENSFWGYAWASHEFEAIVKVAGDVCVDDKNKRDFRWTAIRSY